jgi:L-alanine-DL-glutamate epimerase-like enolase superfamily enzyme
MSSSTKRLIERVFLNGVLKLTLEPYNLKLRTAFGTSHSATTTRTNALIGVHLFNGSEQQQQIIGYGEVGLPPKKPNCYLADYNDIVLFFEMYCNHIESELSQYNVNTMVVDYNPFETLNHKYFKSIEIKSSEENVATIPAILLKVLDKYEYMDENKKPVEYRLAAQCGIEMAILDLLAHRMQQPLHQIIGIDGPTTQSSFYTVGLNPDESEWLKSVELGLSYTTHLKLKLDHDLDKSLQILSKLLSIYTTKELPVTTWSIDANAAWTPELTIQFLQRVKEELPQLLPFLYMVEQPFPVDFLTQVKSDSDLSQQWIQVKKLYTESNVYLFADESVSTGKHIPHIKEYVHGVNIKLEKAGGIRGALTAISVAREHDLRVWLGCMVSSRLSCTCSAHLLALSDIGGDLDGDLLVQEESQLFNGGFIWSTQDRNEMGRVVLSGSGNGISLVRK